MKRYNMRPYYDTFSTIESEEGDWVKWSDIEGLVGAIEDLNRSSYATWMDTLRLKQLIEDKNDK
jgi:hypothetical protein